jgi:ribonuclease HI
MPTLPFIIISDGACSKNPGPGGWGLILVTPDEQVSEFGGRESETTNNRMELMGFYRGLQEIYRLRATYPNARQIHVISDSKYVLEGARSNVERWEKSGWMTTAGSEVKNQDMWEKVLKGLKLLNESQFKFEYELVKGHSGHPGNERVDQIAVKFTHEEPVDLYKGPVTHYSVSIKKGAPFAPIYLSFVNGKLQRHKTWDECKRMVEGQKGARYKKVTSASQEKETLNTWGIDGS